MAATLCILGMKNWSVRTCCSWKWASVCGREVGGDAENGLKILSWWEGNSDSITTCYNKRCAEEHVWSHNILNVGADGLQWQGTTWASQLSVKKGETEANWTTEEIWGEGELACLITTCYIHGVQKSISEPTTCLNIGEQVSSTSKFNDKKLEKFCIKNMKTWSHLPCIRLVV